MSRREYCPCTGPARRVVGRLGASQIQHHHDQDRDQSSRQAPHLAAQPGRMKHPLSFRF